MRGRVSEAERGGGVSGSGVNDGELLWSASPAGLSKNYLKAAVGVPEFLFLCKGGCGGLRTLFI